MNFEEIENLSYENINDLYGNIIEDGIASQYLFYCRDGSIHTINRPTSNYCYRNISNGCWYANAYDERNFCDSRGGYVQTCCMPGDTTDQNKTVAYVFNCNDGTSFVHRYGYRCGLDSWYNTCWYAPNAGDERYFCDSHGGSRSTCCVDVTR